MESNIKSNFNSTDTAKCAKKLKNIEQALCIINNNKIDDNLTVLAAGLQFLVTSNFALIGKTLDTLKHKEDCQYSVPSNFKEGTLKDQCIKLDVNDIAATSSSCTEVIGMKGQPHLSKCIKKMTLTKEKLKKERSILAISKNYLKQKYKCEKCIIGFHFQENLEDHIKRKHNPKPCSISCEVCQQVINPISSYTTHYSRHFTRYKCSQCSKYFHESYKALCHYRKNHNKRNVVNRCKFCDFSCAQSRYFKLHMYKKHDKFWCEGCDLVFVTGNSFQKHRMLKHKKKCFQCSTQFTTSGNFYKHMQLWHTCCAKCGIDFKAWYACWKHMRVCVIHIL